MADESEEPEVVAEGDEKNPTSEEKGKKPEQKYKEVYKAPKCNSRIEELAKPNKASVRFVYKGYRNILPERNKLAVYNFIKEEFAKTPEETEEKFKKHLQKTTEKKCRKICKTKAKKTHVASVIAKKRKSIIKVMEEVLKRYMTKAYFHPKYIIIPSRLRKVSNIILRELCNLRNIPVPNRSNTSIRATLMFAIADFFAYCVDAVYFEMQVKKIEDYEEIKKNKDSSNHSVIQIK